MSRPFGSDHYNIDILGRHNVFEMNIEAVAEAERLAGLEIRSDLASHKPCPELHRAE